MHTLEELKDFLKKFDKQAALQEVSSILTYLYSEEYQNYLNYIQVTAKVCNSILLYANGKDREFKLEDFKHLVVMTSSLNLEKYKNENSEDHISKIILSHSNSFEDVSYAMGRSWYVFNWIQCNQGQLSFTAVTSINLEDLLLTFYGTYALGAKGKHRPIYDPRVFFQNATHTPEEIDQITKIVDKDFSISIEDATEDLKKRNIKNGTELDDVYCPFQSKPFLKIDGTYLLLIPHLGTNELMSISAFLFVNSFSTKHKNDASKYFGEGFEDYVSHLFEDVIAGLEREPSYFNQNNKGVDLVYIKKGKVPLLIEVHKAVIYKSLIHDYTIEKYEAFLRERVIPKFEQTFKWLKSHSYNYNGINLLKKELRRVQFVVCLSQGLPLQQLDKHSLLLLALINESWKKITGFKKKLTLKNIYVLGSYEVEQLLAVSKASNIHPSKILREYKVYHSSRRQVVGNARLGLDLRDDFNSWLSSNYDCKKNKNQLVISYDAKVHSAFEKKFIQSAK